MKTIWFPSLIKNPLSGSVVLIRVFLVGVSLSFLGFNSFFHVPYDLRLPQLLAHLYKTLLFLFIFMYKFIFIGIGLNMCRICHQCTSSYHTVLRRLSHNLIKNFFENICMNKTSTTIPTDCRVIRNSIR